MKDISVEVKKNGVGCSLWLFSTIEALHVWIEDEKSTVDSLQQFVSRGNARRFNFCAGESFRVRWLGCDVVYGTNGKLSVYNLVCLHTTQQTTSDPIHRLFKGYISKDILPLETFDNENISIAETADPDEIEASIISSDIVVENASTSEK